MARWFNIGGPCNAANHYMLPATERLPKVCALILRAARQFFTEDQCPALARDPAHWATK